MLDLFRAEWRKITGNRMATGLLILIFPVGAAAVLVLTIVVALLSSDFRASVAAHPPTWTDEFMFSWNVVNSEIGRLLALAFAAIVFAGEYQWGTWKNIVPRRGAKTSRPEAIRGFDRTAPCGLQPNPARRQS